MWATDKETGISYHKFLDKTKSNRIYLRLLVPLKEISFERQVALEFTYSLKCRKRYCWLQL